MKNKTNMIEDKPRKKPKVEQLQDSDLPNGMPKQGQQQSTGNTSQTGQVFRGLDHETLCEKLKETVDMIKELH